jgi:hypothetical protein
MSFILDGQHKHGTEKKKCFFCVKEKEHCQIFRLEEKPSHPPEYKPLYKQGFVICPECLAKDFVYLARHLQNWLKIQKILSNHGIGLSELERHKKTGTLPKFKKRKKR